MFHQYFEKPRVLRGIESADFQSHLDSFAEELDVVGFAREHVRNQLRAAAHLCVWAGRQRITVEGLGGHLKTGHTWSLQNRPTDRTQNKFVLL